MQSDCSTPPSCLAATHSLLQMVTLPLKTHYRVQREPLGTDLHFVLASYSSKHRSVLHSYLTKEATDDFFYFQEESWPQNYAAIIP